MHTLKILINGWLHSGKAEFIPDDPDSRIAAMEFGRITIDDDTVIYLFAIYATIIHRLMREGFKAQGLIIFTDSTMPEWSSIPVVYIHPHLHTAKEFNLPCVIAANKQDLPGALSPDEIRTRLQIPDDIPVLPCVATDRASVKSVMLALLKRLPSDEVVQKAITKVETLYP